MKDFYRTTKLAVYCMGSRAFVRDDNADFRTIPLREQIHQTGRQMLDLQQRIWELNEEINVNEGKEKLQFILKQNELRKEKEGLQSRKIKPEPFKLEGYDITSDGYFVQRLDQIGDLEF